VLEEAVFFAVDVLVAAAGAFVGGVVAGVSCARAFPSSIAATSIFAVVKNLGMFHCPIASQSPQTRPSVFGGVAVTFREYSFCHSEPAFFAGEESALDGANHVLAS
jgi:hypothetical protein